MDKVPGMPGAIDLARRGRGGVTSHETRLANTNLQILSDHNPQGQPVRHELRLIDTVENRTYIFPFLEARREEFIQALQDAGRILHIPEHNADQN